MRRFCRTLDDATFRELTDRHYEHALRFATRQLSDSTAAYDAVQEAFVRVVRYRHRYSPRKPFLPWFFTILRNICIDFRRKETRYLDLLRRAAETLEFSAGDGSAKGRAAEILSQLTERDAELLELRYAHGMSLAEIADTLGCSAEAAKKRVQRLIKRLRKHARQGPEARARSDSRSPTLPAPVPFW